MSIRIKEYEAEVQDPTKRLRDLIHLHGSMASKVLIPGDTLIDSFDNFLDPRPYIGYEYERRWQNVTSPMKSKFEKDAQILLWN